MDPLELAREEVAKGSLPPRILKSLERKVQAVREGANRIEKASGLPYPFYYISPILPIATSALELGELGILYARTVPVDLHDGLELMVELSAPLVLYSLKGTLQAVMAHEFLHYLEAIRRFRRLEFTSDYVANTLFEATFQDEEHLLEADRVLKDGRLLGLIKRKFKEGLQDPKLEERTVRQWIEKGLPCRRLTPGENAIRIPMSALLKMKVDPRVVRRIDELEGGKGERRYARRGRSRKDKGGSRPSTSGP